MKPSDGALDSLLSGRLSRVGASLLVGPDGGSVPRMARELSLAIARGEPWRGSMTQRGPVLYVHIQVPLGPLRADLSALGVSSEDDLHFLYAQADAQLPGQLRRRARTLAPVLIVVDPLSALLRAEDQASECPASTAFDRVVDLAGELETQVLALHLMGPDSTAELSALLQSTSRRIDALGLVGAGGSLRWIADLGGARSPAPASRTRGESGWAAPKATPAPTISGLAERVLEHLGRHPELQSSAELCRELEVPARELRPALVELLTHGRLLADSPGGGAQEPRYTGCDPEPGSSGWLRRVRPWVPVHPQAPLCEGPSETRAPS